MDLTDLLQSNLISKVEDWDPNFYKYICAPEDWTILTTIGNRLVLVLKITKCFKCVRFIVW